MEEVQPKRRESEQIDYPPLWFLARGAQALVTILFAKMTYLNRGTSDFALDAFSAIGMVLLIAFFLRGIATGTATNSGISYRAYWSEKNVAWKEVQAIEWIGFRLRFAVKAGGKRKRFIVFLLNPMTSLSAYWAHRLGAEARPPEILERIHALPIDTPPQMASASPYPKWFFRTFLVLIALFIFILAWRFLSAVPTETH